MTGTSVRQVWEAERRLLQPVPSLPEPLDVVVTRKVHRDCLVSFEGRRYSVPFAWVGRRVDVWGTLTHVVIRGEGEEIARHVRGTAQRLLIDPRHYEGESTDRVERPTPLGQRARLQMAGLSGASQRALLAALDRQEANLFFRLVSARYEKGSIILTSNKHVRDWPEIFAGDEVLTTAILDRLLHHVHIVHIDGRSYRLRELDGLLRSPPPSPQGKGGDAQTK